VKERERRREQASERERKREKERERERERERIGNERITHPCLAIVSAPVLSVTYGGAGWQERHTHIEVSWSIYIYDTLLYMHDTHCYREVGGWGRDPKKCTERDWGMGSSTI